MNKLLFVFLTIFAITCYACKDDKVETLTYTEQLTLDKSLIDAYLLEKGINADSTDSGLRFIITDLGNNDNNKPNENSTVKVRYKGYNLNGEVFDQTSGSNTAEFAVGGVISGFAEAILMLNKNGKGTFFLPSGLAYGTRGAGGSIPPNTPLIFEIELVDFF
jgi:FKBP-type peptidyl-prolyl cis-trans isomerase FkpA